MRSLYFAIVALISVCELSCARDSSYLPIEYSIGDGEPVFGAKVILRVSPEFSRQDTKAIFLALQTEELRSVLSSVACGETVPEFKFTVSLWREAPMHVRRIEVQETPWLDVGRRNECLVGGMKYFVIKTIEEIERGKRPRNSATGVTEGPASTVAGGVKGVACDCVARSNNLPSVSYQHWPIY